MDTRGIGITLLGSAVNAGLAALKLGLGFLGGSTALVADGVHSLSDLATDLVVLGGIRLASRPADRSHAFGHGKFETLAGVLVALALIGAGAWLIREAAAGLAHPQGAPRSGLVMAVAGVSILAKEALYRATTRTALRLHSTALQANAWHHRSDALSSVAVLLGGATTALGYPIGDKVAAIAVGGMVLMAAASILRRAFHELLEGALSEEEKLAISQAIESVEGVQGWHRLRTRRLGRQALVDVHIQRSLDGLASVVVHVEPKGEEDEWDG